MPMLNRKAFEYIHSFTTYEEYTEVAQPMVAEVPTERMLPDGRVVKGVEHVPVDPVLLAAKIAAIPGIDELARSDVQKFVAVYSERPDTPLSEVVERVRVTVEVALARRDALAAGAPKQITVSTGQVVTVPPQLLQDDGVGRALQAMKLGPRRKGTALEGVDPEG